MKNKKSKKVDFKQGLLNVNLETQIAPVIKEAMGKDYIEYGTEDYRNLYPQFLIDLYYNSSTHAAIVNTTADMIAGEDLTVQEGENLNAYVKLKKFVAQANSRGESLHTIVKKLAFDFKLHGAYGINVVWSKDRSSISELYHVPVERIRMGKPDVTGRVKEYYISADWKQPRKHKPQAVPAFSLTDRTNPNAIIYDGMYSPNMQLYRTPDYAAACNWCLVDQKVAEFHLANIENGFAGSYFINFSNGVPTFEERRDIENSIKDKFTGSSNAGKFVLTFSDDKNRTPEIVPISVSDADKQYLALQELLTQNILTGHRVTSPMLFGIKNNTGLGNNADEMNQAYEMYLNTVVKPYQKNILSCLSKLFEVNDMNLPLEFVQGKPITSKWTIEDMKSVMTQDEIREELGLKPLEETEETLEEEKFSKVGEIDGMNVYDTIEEALQESERLGCSGYHEHEYEGKTVYMACENHDQITEMQKCDCEKPTKECEKECDRYEETELDKFIAEFGEEEPSSDDWTLISNEKVEEEHEDFNFEAELNDIGNYEFATTGRAIPNARSDQDGLDREYNLYKVRYEYATAIASTSSREFCRKMLSANKIYRKEDILRLGDKSKPPVNKGWGLDGADHYSIWLYKGGGNCGHFWRRKIYFYKLGVATGNKIQDATDIIGTVEARSKGFYPKANDPKVSRAPKNMPNNGFVNK